MAYTTINKSSDYFNTKLFTGDGTSDRGITGVGFQPDLVWLKARSKANDHNLFDAVRGLYKLRSNSTAAEASVSSEFKSFDSDGITVTENATSEFNNNNTTYALWNWKANGAGSANTDGSITSTVSANTTAGFSIVSWTGTGANASIGHGLNAQPKWIFLKCRTQGDKWIVYHNSIGNSKYLILNENQSPTISSTHFNNTSPTNAVFYTGTSGNVSGTGETFIAYCFADKTGYSKASGSYVGNGNADGTFVYTGFKPAFYMIKRTDTTGSWIIKGTKRPGYNVNGTYLVADTNIAEATGSGNLATDELSNGFKIRGSSTAINASGGIYSYMAFAEAPLVGSNGVTAKAR